MNRLIVLQLPYHQDSSFYFSKVRKLPYPILLDSAIDASISSKGRYSILSADPVALLSQDCGQLQVKQKDLPTEFFPPEQLINCQRNLLAQIAPIRDQRFPFTGGLIGFWGYELNQFLTTKPLARSPKTPNLKVGLYLWSLTLDHKKKTCHLVAHPSLGETLFSLLVQRFNSQEIEPQFEPFELKDPWQSDMSYCAYQNAFNKIKGYIKSGDCYQVNLCQRFSNQFSGDLWEAYQRLKALSPAPFSAFLDYSEFKIMSFSPEMFLQSQKNQVTTQPIKGTKKRSNCPLEDKKLANALQKSDKDKAENLMIVDLLRNDLSRCCEAHSVKTPLLFQLQSYANVHHLVSTITGKIQSQFSTTDLLLSAFPGGSITGAPKIRAMEIINELEPHARSAYCGSIGYLSSNGQMNTNIAIRTLVANNNDLWCWGGGAITGDSECEEEYQESITKIKNLMQGLESQLLTN